MDSILSDCYKTCACMSMVVLRALDVGQVRGSLALLCTGIIFRRAGTVPIPRVCMTGSRDTFSYRVVIYAACFFVAYKLLFQLSYVEKLSKLWLVAAGLILIHAVVWLWRVGACVFTREPRRLASLACAAAVVAGLQWY